MIETPRWIFAMLATLGLLMVVSGEWYASAWTQPTVHPQFKTMEVGGPRAKEDTKNWFLGLLFGVTMFATLATCLSLSADQMSRGRSLRWAIGLAGSLIIVMFVVMLIAQQSYAADPQLWGPFASSTTWMLLGIWLIPNLFTLIYVVGFRHWFTSDQTVLIDESTTGEVTES